MAGCRSWKPVPGVDKSHIGHLPGGCRVCWAPCFARVPRGTVRCQDCLLALRDHVTPFVRSALAAEPDVSDDILAFLADDMDMSVSSMARRAQARRHGGHHSREDT
jgi:hypothetical protein